MVLAPGLVLDGTTVALVVPGSPCSGDHAGKKIEPGDVVMRIDNESVGKHDIVAKMRGADVPGSELTLTVRKRGSQEILVLQLHRADMRSVMAKKDLFLALGDVHTELDNPHADTHAKLRSRLELVELRIEEFLFFCEEQYARQSSHVADLEDAIRDLWGSRGDQEDAEGMTPESVLGKNGNLLTLLGNHTHTLERASALSNAPRTPKLPKDLSTPAPQRQSDRKLRTSLAEHPNAPPRSQTEVTTARLSRDLPMTSTCAGDDDVERGREKRVNSVGFEKRVLSNGTEIWVTDSLQ